MAAGVVKSGQQNVLGCGGLALVGPHLPVGPAPQRRIVSEFLRLGPPVVADDQVKPAVRPVQDRVRPMVTDAALHFE